MGEKIVIGFDPGFGYVNATRFDKSKIIEIKFPSAVSWSDTESKNMYDDGRKFWNVGESALLSKNIVEITTYDELKSHSRLLLLEAISNLGLEPEDIGTVVCGLSLAHVSRAQEFAEYLSCFTLNGKKYSFSIKLVPQGVGAKYAIDHESSSNAKQENFMVIDVGANTIDTLVSINGSVISGTQKGHEGRGVRRVASMLQQVVADKDLEHLSVQEALKALEDGHVKQYGVTTPLKDEIQNISKTFTEETMTFIKDKYSNELKRMDTIYFVGGGAYYIQKDYMPHFFIPNNPEFFNARGNLLSYKKGA